MRVERQQNNLVSPDAFVLGETSGRNNNRFEHAPAGRTPAGGVSNHPPRLFGTNVLGRHGFAARSAMA